MSVNHRPPSDRITDPPVAVPDAPAVAAPARRAWTLRLRDLAGPVLIAVAGAAMLALGWDRWADPLIDYGRELYVPWQLASGKVLYRDLAYFNGPLSPYLNALWFRLFGASLLTLTVSNTVVAALIAALLHSLLLGVSGRFAATTACLVYVTVFACGLRLVVGSFSYIAPYSHEMTHGILLSLAGIYCLRGYHRRGWLGWIVGAGLALGCVFLTKAEVFAATALALTVGLLMALWVQRPGWRSGARVVGVFVLSAAAVPLAAWALLSTAMPALEAFQGVLGSWRWVSDSRLSNLLFYRIGMGTLDTRASLITIAKWIGLFALFFLPPLALALVPRQPARIQRLLMVGIPAIGMALLWQQDDAFWSDVLSPLQVVLCVMGVVVLVRCLRPAPPAGKAAERMVMRGALIAFALGMLAKMILNVTVYGYGFGLAMPGTMLLAIALVHWIPTLVDRRGGCGRTFQAAGLAAIVVWVVVNVRLTHLMASERRNPVTTHHGTLWMDWRGRYVQKLVDALALAPDGTLAVLSEGASINFLTRRINPTRFSFLEEPDLVMFGEQPVVASFQAHPPDYIVLVHPERFESGTWRFRRGYAEALLGWVASHYEVREWVAPTPSGGGEFGILLLQRAR